MAVATEDAVRVKNLSFRYNEGSLPALDEVSLTIAAGETFGLLGPNGSGKTTLFRVLCTLLPPQSGQVTIFGHDLLTRPDAVRRLIGVTFQSPSLDRHLTVVENLSHQARLYGLTRRTARVRIAELLDALRLTDRANSLVATLSGGLKRRTEIAKGLLHQPELLLLDEPSTGLDPGARGDLWRYLRQLAVEMSITIVTTTHLMDEADQCRRLAILNRGQLVALGTPDELRQSVGGDCLTIRTAAPSDLAESIRRRFGVEATRIGDSLRIERDNGHELLHELVTAFPESIENVSLGKPTLEDVFIQRTGHQFWEADASS